MFLMKIVRQKHSNRFFLICILLLITLLVFIIVKVTQQSPTQRKLIGIWNVEMNNSFCVGEWDWVGSHIIIEKNNELSLPSVYNESYKTMKKESSGTDRKSVV